MYQQKRVRTTAQEESLFWNRNPNAKQKSYLSAKIRASVVSRGRGLLDWTDLEKSPEWGATDGTIVGLVTQGICTAVAQAQVATWKDQCVPCITHTDNTFCSTVLGLIIMLVTDSKSCQ